MWEVELRFIRKEGNKVQISAADFCCRWGKRASAPLQVAIYPEFFRSLWAGLQAAERQACWTLWAHVLSSSVTECLSGSCSSLDVMVLWTFSRKLLVPAGRGTRLCFINGPRPARLNGRNPLSHRTGHRRRPRTGSARGNRQEP